MTLIGAFIAVAIEITLLVILVFSIKYRSVFIKHHPRLRRFYDYILLGFIISTFAKLAFLPLDLGDIGLIVITSPERSMLNLLGNTFFIVGIFFIVLGWAHLIKTLTTRYTLTPVVEFGDGRIQVKVSSGLYICDIDRCYSVFLNLLKGRAGAIISRIPPEVLRKRLNLEKTPILWLTKVEGENTVHPHRLEFLLHTLVDFMRRNNKPKVILLDGLEYLVLENGFIPVFRFLASLKDYAVMNNTVIVVPIRMDTFDKKELSLLKREFGELEL